MKCVVHFFAMFVYCVFVCFLGFGEYVVVYVLFVVVGVFSVVSDYFVVRYYHVLV